MSFDHYCERVSVDKLDSINQPPERRETNMNKRANNTINMNNPGNNVGNNWSNNVGNNNEAPNSICAANGNNACGWNDCGNVNASCRLFP